MNTRIGRKKSKNPPYFSHEFVITNHGDIVSILAMIIIVGLLHKGTHVLSSSFIFIQYNNTDEHQENALLYSPGVKDLCVIFFYTLICIVCHAVLQEYIFDRVVRKLSLTKVRLAKFNESAHLACFYALSTAWAIYSIVNENFIGSLSSLWDDYPQRWVPFWIKLFFITQICYWLHDYPELYFQRVKNELIPARLLHATIYLLGISFAYFGGLTKLCMVVLILHYGTDFFLHVSRALHLAEYKFASIGFTLWNLTFIPVRMACIILGFLTLHHGLGKSSVMLVNISDGNFNTPSIRVAAMLFFFTAQALMVWNFITFHQRHRRDKQQSHTFKSWLFANQDPVQRRKDKKKVKREDEDTSDQTETDQNPQQKESKRRKPTKARS
uniref:Translocating chain-associated membrane protein n=1 Tax=Schistosoma japonicum TaxID=6182 RepID=C1LIH6_SCHJA|nr:Translocation-associated membrane protein 1 [Schistosoma japonicum]